jgi:hypothetical protein
MYSCLRFHATGGRWCNEKKHLFFSVCTFEKSFRIEAQQLLAKARLEWNCDVAPGSANRGITAGSSFHTSAMSTGFRTWLSLRRVLVGDVVSRLSRGLGSALLLSNAAESCFRIAHVQRAIYPGESSRLPSVP